MENQIVKHGEFDEMQRVASALAASGYFDTAKEHKIAIAQMVTKIMAGAEMGFPPFASVQGVNIIKGRPTLSANLMAAAVKGHPRYDYRIREMTDQKVVIEFFEGDESLGKSEFSKGDLERAESGSLVAPGAKKSMKERFPRNMLFARAMSNGVRWFTPDLFSGNSVYTPGEIDGNADDGAIDTEWQVEQPKPQPAPAPHTNGTPDDVDFGGTGDNPFDDAGLDDALEGDPVPAYIEARDRLTGNCAKLAEWARQKHMESNGPATDAQYQYLAGTIDKHVGEEGAHRLVLSVLCRAEISNKFHPGAVLATKLLDFILKEIKNPENKDEKIANPNYRQDYVNCLSNIYRVAQGQAELLPETETA